MDLLAAAVQLMVIVMFWGCVLGGALLIWLFLKVRNRGDNGRVHRGATAAAQSRGDASGNRQSGPSSSSASTLPSSKTSGESSTKQKPPEQKQAYSESSPSEKRPKEVGASEYYRLDPATQDRYDKAIRENMFGPDEQNPRLDEMLGRKPLRGSERPKRIPPVVGAGGSLPQEERKRLRANEAESKERVRSALRALYEKRDPEGWSVYYVFDEIATNSAGIAEQVAVGPWGVCIVVVYDLPKGKVTLDSHTNRYRLNGEYFEEDPDERGCALVADVRPHIFGESAPVYYLVCFTSVGEDCVEREDYPGSSCSVWDLATTLVSGGEPIFTHEEVDEIARKVREGYNREPHIQPTQRAIEEAVDDVPGEEPPD